MTNSLTTLYREARKGHKTRYPDGKKCAIPSLHRDNILAKVPGFNRCSRRVTQPPFIAGPLVQMDQAKIGFPPYHDKFLMTTKILVP
jgi:hypothetical protein